MELYISKIRIHNYRSIQNTEFDLKKQNIIIGKNNIGKSNVINAFDSFRSLKLEDINVDFLEKLWNKSQGHQEPSDPDDCVRLELTYHWKDLPSEYWFLLSTLATEGDTKIVITYRVSESMYDSFFNMKSIQDLLDLLEESFEVGTPEDFENGQQQAVAKTRVPSYLPSKDNKPNFKLFRIDAMRNTTQGKHSNQNEIGQTLAPEIAPLIEKQSKTLKKIQGDVDEDMNGSLDQLQDELHRFAYPHDEKAPLQAVWTIDEWLKNPGIRLSKVYDNLDKFEIPLQSQGLGYQNIYNIIARLNNLFSDLKQNPSEAPVLIVIEEPEVFTHPQLQHVFIQQIQEYVEEHGQACIISCQLIIISHSPEVAVSALSLNFDLIIGRSHKENTRFINWNQLGAAAGEKGIESRDKLRKLVLSYNAELFFADKLLCYEGDGERLILGSLMRNRDKFESGHGLMSEKVALLPVGTHFTSYRAALADLLFDQILVITDVDFHLKPSVETEKLNSSSKSDKDKKETTTYWKFGVDECETIKTTNSNLALLGDINADKSRTSLIDLKVLIKRRQQTLANLFSNDGGNWDMKSSAVEFERGMICRVVGLTSDDTLVDLATPPDSEIAELMITTQGFIPEINFWPRTLESALIFSDQKNFDLYMGKHLLQPLVEWSSRVDPRYNDVEKKLLASTLHKADFATESLDVLTDENFSMPRYLKVGLDWLVGIHE
ncbi:AAA family ATPase [Lacticaseibacillus paracasei]|uniref:ATP-dependent nuclease n=1 Tax=Lacticaseibacillus paracasei TaxID=1597 RepID=UPI0021AF13E6|nr:AAA family ATPase [Lacticaseibacillus paracasei]UWY23251.1 AAA family ATPase [Lacticaseibacillus paracasei]